MTNAKSNVINLALERARRRPYHALSNESLRALRAVNVAHGNATVATAIGAELEYRAKLDAKYKTVRRADA